MRQVSGKVKASWKGIGRLEALVNEALVFTFCAKNLKIKKGDSDRRRKYFWILQDSNL
jgi:hypothetical protein